MRDIRVVIVTVDRAPKENYLHYTLANLQRAGVFESERLESLHLIDSGSEQPSVDDLTWWPERALVNIPYFRLFPSSVPETWTFDADPRVYVHHDSLYRRSGKQNTARALRIGAMNHSGWVLHLEDDLAVCGAFLDSVGRWLDRFEGDDLTRMKRPIYPFSGDNATIRTQMANGEASWEYPVAWFWGLQAFACRPEVANDLAQWFEDHPLFTHSDGRKDENAHDLEMHHWANERGYTHFRGSCPSFVQHIGFETSILGNVMGGARVTFPSWPGPDWVYR